MQTDTCTYLPEPILEKRLRISYVRTKTQKCLLVSRSCRLKLKAGRPMWKVKQKDSNFLPILPSPLQKIIQLFTLLLRVPEHYIHVMDLHSSKLATRGKPM